MRFSMSIKRGRFALILFPLLLLTTLFILWGLKGRKIVQETRAMELPVKVMSVTRTPLAQSLELSGIIESENQITLVPRVPGRIDSLLVEPGDRVQKNTLVAIMDGEVYQLALLQAKAAYEAAESTYSRISTLYQSGSTSQESFNQSRAQYESLKSQYDLARLRYEYTRITSPIEGTVLVKHLNEGAMAGLETPILTLGSISRLEVETRVPEIYLPYFLADSPHMIGSISHPTLKEAQISGRIKSVSPYISPETRDFSVIISLEANDLLRPGMLLYVTYNLVRKENMPSLPREALVENRWLWYVDEENLAHRLEYKEIFESYDLIALPEEWEDLSFIIEGQHFLSEGQLVKVLEDRE
jgi:membrane fusion protein (multidrug efflux system)